MVWGVLGLWDDTATVEISKACSVSARGLWGLGLPSSILPVWRCFASVLLIAGRNPELEHDWAIAQSEEISNLSVLRVGGEINPFHKEM